MKTGQMDCAALERLLHREVPLSATMGMEVHSYDGSRLELSAHLQPNVNIYGVAFGGSIYSMCALCGWGMLIMKLDEVALDPRIMITGGNIRYFKPVDQSIRAVCVLSDRAAFDTFAQCFRESAQARLDVEVEVLLEDDSRAALFEGNYIALDRSRSPGMKTSAAR